MVMVFEELLEKELCSFCQTLALNLTHLEGIMSLVLMGLALVGVMDFLARSWNLEKLVYFWLRLTLRVMAQGSVHR